MNELLPMQQLSSELSASPRASMRMHLAFDPRADGGHRTVRFDPGQVMIGRNYHGVKMRLVVPLANYIGVAMMTTTGIAQPTHRICLVHGDKDLCVGLFETADPAKARRMWRAWGRFFGCPLLIGSEETGWWTVEDLCPTPAALTLRPFDRMPRASRRVCHRRR